MFNPESRGAAAARIIKTLEEHIAPLDDPRTLGSALTGNQARYWRWRIGDYQVVARAGVGRITVLVVSVVVRGEVYR
ncbi:MAG: type II toxin-antitoxin system RelE/ParE family toxin [Sphingomonas sp.]|uniref:type II toxin-antitoxin system RelE family toxin n=1 Tax=Sphingomonas sp. TaxID=28214 RepID=UPI0035A8C91F|nr:type II toxin-antitoxin system RelE/ParE family toxin [Sphingomonas sp.]